MALANRKRVALFLGITIAVVLVIAGWVEYQDKVKGERIVGNVRAPLAINEAVRSIDAMEIQKVTFNTNKGSVKLELYTKLMPITTENFLKLVEEGFYNNTKFHRVIEGFMVQGGDPLSKDDNLVLYGQGGPGYTIEDEFVEHEALSNLRGTISMANTGQPNSGGSQFFINLADNIFLDFDKEPFASKHPVFGRVIEGMGVVDAIARVQTDENDIPVEDVVVESITVE